MGEANRREAAVDVHRQSVRGLVVSPSIEISGGAIHIKSADLDPQEVRSNLLFWDKLDFPDQNMIHFGLSKDSEFLLKSGILQRTHVTLTGTWDGAAALRSAHLAAFAFLDKSEPGLWSLATGAHSMSFHDGDLDVGRGALVRLYNAIPIPDKSVPLADILEFRSKRKDEMTAFRIHLEAVYQRVINAGDGPLAWNTEIDALQRSISDHIKVSYESKLRLCLADISAELNLVTIGMTMLSARAVGLPLVPSIATGLAAGISLNIGSALKRRKAVATPFRYVTSYHQKLF
jgi:hypothetical protein